MMAAETPAHGNGMCGAVANAIAGVAAADAAALVAAGTVGAPVGGKKKVSWPAAPQTAVYADDDDEEEELTARKGRREHAKNERQILLASGSMLGR